MLKSLHRLNCQQRKRFFIDTDEVIYIENEPNYHTYTFNITRENALPGDPLENLVLSPLTDGTYRELLITYQLTAEEKETLSNGGYVDVRNKSTTTEITGLYNSGGALARTTCNWEIVGYEIIPCSKNEHGSWNMEDWHRCVAPSKPGYAAIREYRCFLDNTEDGSESGGGGTGTGGGVGGGGEGGTDPNDEPCNGNGVLTEPQQPGITDPNGCAGIPSVPTSPTRNTPCKNLKNTTHNTNGLKSKLDSLNKKNILELNYEKGATVSEDAQGNTTLTSQDGNPGNTFITVNIPTTGEVIVYVHTHFEASDMLPVFTIEDLITFDAIHFQRRANNKSLDKVAMMVISKAGVFAMMIEDSDLFYTMGGKLLTNDRANLEEKYYGDLRKKVSVTNDDVIKQISKSLPDYGISMYKANADLSNWSKMSYNPTTDKVEEIPCN